jgi:hypothetical protein
VKIISAAGTRGLNPTPWLMKNPPGQTSPARKSTVSALVGFLTETAYCPPAITVTGFWKSPVTVPCKGAALLAVVVAKVLLTGEPEASTASISKVGGVVLLA